MPQIRHIAMKSAHPRRLIVLGPSVGDVDQGSSSRAPGKFSDAAILEAGSAPVHSRFQAFTRPIPRPNYDIPQIRVDLRKEESGNEQAGRQGRPPR